VHIGVMALANADGLWPGELAKAAEDRDLESVWFSDHSHIPVQRESAWPGGRELPATYYGILDPLVCMALAAAATTRLRVGTAVLLLAERDPIHLAKSIACIDVLSQGRVEVGVGGGWNHE
jgi:alkanesulfonate monooxygenase SsuD/methylene tetrahydromethanopterin reductase-like flavin-dependent oxidoreductase (luciferase family)